MTGNTLFHFLQHTLRLLVEKSLSTFINLVETPCLPCLPVTEDFIWGSDLLNSPFISKASPIFTLQLKMNEHGAFYSTKPEMFQVIFTLLFYKTNILAVSAPILSGRPKKAL